MTWVDSWWHSLTGVNVPPVMIGDNDENHPAAPVFKVSNG